MSDPKAEPTLPADNLSRNSTLLRPSTDAMLPHTGLVGDPYTITLSGKNTRANDDAF